MGLGRSSLAALAALCASVAALAGAGVALGDAAFGLAGGAPNDRPLPCVGAPGIADGTVAMAASLGRADVTATAGGRLRLDLRSAILVGYRPRSASRPSYVGVRVVARRLTLAPGVDQVDVPLTIPLQGSDGTRSAVATTETIFLTSSDPGAAEANLLVDDVRCAKTQPRAHAPRAAIAPDRRLALESLVARALGRDGSSAIAGSLALGSGVSPFSATLAGRAFGGSLAAFASGDAGAARLQQALQQLETPASAAAA